MVYDIDVNSIIARWYPVVVCMYVCMYVYVSQGIVVKVIDGPTCEHYEKSVGGLAFATVAVASFMILSTWRKTLIRADLPSGL